VGVVKGKERERRKQVASNLINPVDELLAASILPASTMTRRIGQAL
jgi:hypothetical protein